MKDLGKLAIWVAGAVIGLAAVLLVLGGNPLNMGFCIACFERDIAGALGLHRAAVVQYIRPEIIGIVLGAMIAAFFSREYRAEGGSAPATRFILGMLVMIGALVFLGCPLRMVLRMAGGDLNAWVALVGFIVGIYVGVIFLRKGFNLGRSQKVSKLDGWILPLIMVGLLVLLLVGPVFNPEAGGPVFFSKEGPGSMHAAVIWSIIAGLAVGFLAQRTRLCLAGGIRNLFLTKTFSADQLVWGFVAIFGVVLVGNLLTGKFTLGFADQPVAHTQHLWNFLGMSLVGLGSALVGGCPLRNLILAGSGNTDSVMYILGAFVGAAVAHNFMLAASPKGVSVYGQIAVIVGLAVVIVVGLLNRER